MRSSDESPSGAGAPLRNASAISAGAVPGMLEWMPSSSGGACMPIVWVTAAPQSPPCATNRL